jgi:hypothetical protein
MSSRDNRQGLRLASYIGGELERGDADLPNNGERRRPPSEGGGPHGRRLSRLHRGAEALGWKWASFGPTAKAQEVKAVQRREGPDCPGQLVLAEAYSENVL